MKASESMNTNQENFSTARVNFINLLLSDSRLRRIGKWVWARAKLQKTGEGVAIKDPVNIYLFHFGMEMCP